MNTAKEFQSTLRILKINLVERIQYLTQRKIRFTEKGNKFSEEELSKLPEIEARGILGSGNNDKIDVLKVLSVDNGQVFIYDEDEQDIFSTRCENVLTTQDLINLLSAIEKKLS